MNATVTDKDPRAERIPTKPLLSEMHGMAAARAWGENLASAITDYRARKIGWSDVDPGCLLFGPPGTGKTLFATALAASCKLPLVKATFGDWQSADDGHLGDCLAAIRATFEEAAALAPCILHIDELDSIPARGRGQHALYWNAVTNDILKAIDRAADTPGIVIIGCCNNPELLDPALVRAGRLDRKIEIGYPTLDEIPDIIKFHLTFYETVSVLCARKHDAFRLIAQMAQGLSSAELAQLVRAVRSRARARKAKYLGYEDFVAELDPPDRKTDAALEQLIAVHEAGHAIAGYRLGVITDVNLSIITHARRGGVTRFMPTTPTMTRATLLDRLTMIMAGRAAEDIFFGAPSTGAGGNDQSDLAQATKLARDAIAIHGLSKRNSLYWHGDVTPHAYPHDVRAEVEAILVEAYDAAKALIIDDWDYVNEVAAALRKSRVMDFRTFRLLDRRPTRQSGTRPDQVSPHCGQVQK